MARSKASTHQTKLRGFAIEAARLLHDRRCDDVVLLDVRCLSQVCDYVLIGKYSGTEIKLDGEEYLIVREDEILGIAEGVPELATV